MRGVLAVAALGGVAVMGGCTQNVVGDMTATCTPAGHGTVVIGLVPLQGEMSAHTVVSVTIEGEGGGGGDVVVPLPAGSIVQPGTGFSVDVKLPRGARISGGCTVKVVTSEV